MAGLEALRHPKSCFWGLELSLTAFSLPTLTSKSTTLGWATRRRRCQRRTIFDLCRHKYRDPSLGVARLRARLRCLRMTIDEGRSVVAVEALRHPKSCFWGLELSLTAFSLPTLTSK